MRYGNSCHGLFIRPLRFQKINLGYRRKSQAWVRKRRIHIKPYYHKNMLTYPTGPKCEKPIMSMAAMCLTAEGQSMK